MIENGDVIVIAHFRVTASGISNVRWIFILRSDLVRSGRGKHIFSFKIQEYSRFIVYNSIAQLGSIRVFVVG